MTTSSAEVYYYYDVFSCTTIIIKWYVIYYMNIRKLLCAPLHRETIQSGVLLEYDVLAKRYFHRFSVGATIVVGFPYVIIRVKNKANAFKNTSTQPVC